MAGAFSNPMPADERLRVIEQSLIRLLDEVHQLREEIAADPDELTDHDATRSS